MTSAATYTSVATATTSTNTNSSKPKSFATDPKKKKSEFRNYTNSQRQATVENFYKLQHTNMTYKLVMEKRSNHLKFDKCKLSIWEMAQYLNEVVDDSDPDTDLTQLEHAIQTAEAIRKSYPDDKYDWLHVTAFIHDLGKILAVTDKKKNLSAEPQWCVVGDNFPIGCRFSPKNVFYEFFEENADFNNSKYNSKFGIYSENCGLMNVLMSFGHDEYMYNIAKNQSKLPLAALYILRFHSFYAWHTGGDYMYLCDEKDIELGLKWVSIFNKCDLYSKSDECPLLEEVAEYYKMKIEKYFPNIVQW